jgi:hypothetical protein
MRRRTTQTFVKVKMGSPLFNSLYCMFTVTHNELKAVLKVSTQAGQSGAVNETSMESEAQDDDFREVNRRKRHISNDTSQRAKKSTKPIPKAAAVKLPPKAMLTRKIFTTIRTTDMDRETNGAENVLLEPEAPRKLSRPPLIVMTSATNLIRLQSVL